MKLLTRKWAVRFVTAKRSTPQLRLGRLQSLRYDIKTLIGSLLRNGYRIHKDILVWNERIDNEITTNKAG